MEELNALLFELANIDRLEILMELHKDAMKLTNIAKKLDLTVQETSRHLQRLCDALLLQKQADGAYHITPHGVNVLFLLPGLKFLVRHRDYFLTHRLDLIPAEFIARIGVLQDSKLLDSPVIAFQKVNTIVDEAKEHLYMIADQVPSGSIPLIEAAVKRGVNLRILMTKNTSRPDIPEAYLPHYSEEDMEKMLLGWTDKIAFVGVISENAAVVGFQTAGGTMDYLAFYTQHELALRWSYDLFMHYWMQVEHSHPINE